MSIDLRKFNRTEAEPAPAADVGSGLRKTRAPSSATPISSRKANSAPISTSPNVLREWALILGGAMLCLTLLTIATDALRKRLRQSALPAVVETPRHTPPPSRLPIRRYGATPRDCDRTDKPLRGPRKISDHRCSLSKPSRSTFNCCCGISELYCSAPLGERLHQTRVSSTTAAGRRANPHSCRSIFAGGPNGRCR